jgi:orotate phosphoribosyltransferase
LTPSRAARSAVEAVRAAGLVVRTAVCVVDRDEGGSDELARHAVRLRALYKAGDFVSS